MNKVAYYNDNQEPNQFMDHYQQH